MLLLLTNIERAYVTIEKRATCRLQKKVRGFCGPLFFRETGRFPPEWSVGGHVLAAEQVEAARITVDVAVAVASDIG